MSTQLFLRQIAEELHNGLCQSLTIVILKSKKLEQKLARKSFAEEAAEARKLTALIEEAVKETRRLVNQIEEAA